MKMHASYYSSVIYKFYYPNPKTTKSQCYYFQQLQAKEILHIVGILFSIQQMLTVIRIFFSILANLFKIYHTHALCIFKSYALGRG